MTVLKKRATSLPERSRGGVAPILFYLLSDLLLTIYYLLLTLHRL